MVGGGIGREMEKRVRGGRGGWVAIFAAAPLERRS